MGSSGPKIPPGVDLWTTPAGRPPPGSGIIPNLTDPPTNKDIGTVTVSIWIAIATIFVFMRFYVRFRVHRSPWWDDLAIAIALPCQIAYSGITIWFCEAGLVGRHIWDTPLAIPLLKLPYWTVVLAVLPQPITFLVKVSLLLLYYRIFQPFTIIRYGIWFGIVVTATMYTVWFFVFIFQTVLSTEVGAHLSWAQAAFNVASDVYILILPLVGALRLQLSWRKKAGVIAVFLTGSCAVAMSILTLYYRVQYNGNDPDPTWHATARITVSCLELSTGLWCACMPLFAPFFPKRARINDWLHSVQSLRSRLLRRTTEGSEYQSTNAQPSGRDSRESVQKGTSIQMEERSSSMGSNSRQQPREWFDHPNHSHEDA